MLPGNHFCSYCNAFAYDPKLGKKAGLVKRWLANGLFDPLIFIITLSIGYWVALAYGTTPGHKMLGMKFVNQMEKKQHLARCSSEKSSANSSRHSFFGLGYFWPSGTKTAKPGTTKSQEHTS